MGYCFSKNSLGLGRLQESLDNGVCPGARAKGRVAPERSIYGQLLFQSGMARRGVGIPALSLLSSLSAVLGLCPHNEKQKRLGCFATVFFAMFRHHRHAVETIKQCMPFGIILGCADQQGMKDVPVSGPRRAADQQPCKHALKRAVAKTRNVGER